MAPPTRLAIHTRPWARARSAAGDQREIVLELFGDQKEEEQDDHDVPRFDGSHYVRVDPQRGSEKGVSIIGPTSSSSSNRTNSENDAFGNGRGRESPRLPASRCY